MPNDVQPATSHLASRATIVKATAADAAEAWQLRNQAILRACKGFYDDSLLARWTAGEMTAAFEAFVDRHLYAATLERKMLGTGAVDLDDGKVDAVFVHPDWMGLGIGARIIRHLSELARHAGLKELWLESTLNAAPFYRRCGFAGDTVGTYQSPRGLTLPCVPMRMKIADL